jgi:hypothetical protein
VELKLNLKLVKGPIHSLEKAKSKIPVKQNIGLAHENGIVLQKK